MTERLTIVPCELDDANRFVEQHHRHHGAVRGHRFSLALARGSAIVGVAIVGRPTARGNQDGWTVECLRNCTDGTRNAPSMLYGACWRAARALGWRRLITYTGKHEAGSSLRAAGFVVIGEVKGRSWDTPTRPRVDRNPLQDKLCWAVSA